jgi:hypothetical protein
MPTAPARLIVEYMLRFATAADKADEGAEMERSENEP